MNRSEIGGSGRLKAEWINELAQHSLKPSIKLLEEISVYDLLAERRWIEHLISQGARLVNGNCLPLGKGTEQ